MCLTESVRCQVSKFIQAGVGRAIGVNVPAQTVEIDAEGAVQLHQAIDFARKVS